MINLCYYFIKKRHPLFDKIKIETDKYGVPVGLSYLSFDQEQSEYRLDIFRDFLGPYLQEFYWESSRQYVYINNE